MGRTFIRQDAQIANSDAYTDSTAPSLANFETNPANIEDDLNNVRSQLNNLLADQAGNWYDDLNIPSALETGTQRGVNNLNTDLHALEKKRVLKCVWGLKTITIAGAGDTFDILALSEIPGNTQARVGITTGLGTVVADNSGGFGAFSLAEVAGQTAISPKNLVQIVDAATRDPVLDAGNRIYGLLQGETATDFTITGTTPNRVQISFVKVNGTGDDLIAITSGAMDGVSYDYCYVERVRLEDLNEADFLGNADVDVPAGTTVSRQAAYDGGDDVTTTSNAVATLGTGLNWDIVDQGANVIFRATEGDAGGTGVLEVGVGADTLSVESPTNSFTHGASFDDGAAGTTINVGVTANQIDFGGAGDVRSAAATDLTVFGQGELILNDGNMVAEGTWAGPGVKVSDTTAEVAAYETAFGGEVSLMNAIVQANGSAQRDKAVAVATANAAADVNITGTGGGANLDANLCDYSALTFVDDVDVYLNGVLLRNGANAAANHDVYPGDTPANGDIKFEFAMKGTGSNPDQITMICWG